MVHDMQTTKKIGLDKDKVVKQDMLPKFGFNQESVAGSVIQATGMVTLKDRLRPGVFSGDCRCPCGDNN